MSQLREMERWQKSDQKGHKKSKILLGQTVTNFVYFSTLYQGGLEKERQHFECY
jgi:hypothetical protein